MSDSAIFDTTEAIRASIGQAVGGVALVHVGPPIAGELAANRIVSLFMFHVEINAALRNELRYAAAPSLEPATRPTALLEALPLDLRYLITVLRDPNAQSDEPNELTKLGQIIQRLHVNPTLAGTGMNGQVVRLTPESYPMEELSRVWGLFPQEVYRTSVVYLASPVIVEARPAAAGRAVEHREQRSGIATVPPDLLRRGAEVEVAS